MIFEIFYFLLALSFGLLSAYLLFIAVYRTQKPASPAFLSSFPSVTILKPMKNIDDGLEENLISFFTLEYPEFNIIFAVDEFEDTCVGVIENVRKKYPDINAAVVRTGTTKAVNPKIDKLAKMSKECTSRLFWVADSNIRVEKDTLTKLVSEYIRKDSKIVFSPIKGDGAGSFGSIMANSYMNLFVSGNIIGSWALIEKPIIVGKSMLIERDTLEKLGGFSAFDSYLAEDYMMGVIYREHGENISTNYTWVTNFSSTTSISTFYARMSRWAKMRFRIDPFFYCMEIFTNPLAIAFISIFFLGLPGITIFAAAFILKLAIEYISMILVNSSDRANIKILAAYPLCVLIKDTILFAVYVSSFFFRTVSWHGKRITIGSQSRINNPEKKATNYEKL